MCWQANLVSNPGILRILVRAMPQSQVMTAPKPARVVVSGSRNRHENGRACRTPSLFFFAAILGLAPQLAAAENVKTNGRSAFEYNDGSPVEKRPYRQPRLDVDPTDLTVEELKERLNHLEDRIERLENSLRSAEARP